jgi:hypothetical protein
MGESPSQIFSRTKLSLLEEIKGIKPLFRQWFQLIFINSLNDIREADLVLAPILSQARLRVRQHSDPHRIVN